MSRHTIPHPTEPHLTLTYGYDRPLQYYFYQVHSRGEIVDSDECAGCTAHELFNKAAEHGFTLPPNHEYSAAMDLPIGEDPPPAGWKPKPIKGWTPPPPQWRWGAEFAPSEEAMCDAIQESIVEQLNEGEDTAFVYGPDGREYAIHVTVQLLEREQAGDKS